ncbi:MAG: class I SAM-dependent methyltransferase [Alistipes sp.]|nr:class I SAM-dependent methyltransferase [Alistipes sp.]
MSTPKITTAERVSTEASDNFVFQRSLLAYHAAAERIAGDVLEIGTGTGYGIEVVAPHAARFVTLDKHAPALPARPGVEFRQATVPPLPFDDGSFDCVISFQVIEHIERDAEFVREIHRVLRPGGRFVVTTPNAPMSLTRNPWHVREYRADELRRLLAGPFRSVETLGVFGNEKVMAYYEQNRRGVERIARFDIFDLQHRLPRRLLQLPYDLLNRLNRRRLLRENTDLTTSIRMEDYRLGPVGDDCFDLFFIAEK